MNNLKFDHVGLSVQNLELEQAFYAKAFEMTTVEEAVNMPEAQIRTMILSNENGLKIELIERQNSQAQEFEDAYDGANTQGYFHWALNVKNLDEIFVKMLNFGAKAVQEPQDAMKKGAKFAYVKDPEGNLIELIQPRNEEN